ncbi:hypothetical protein JZ751_009953 [Albula glossodonta]|uniref:Uncharacterized protein n=1 Tax=Albula glossodonta TaxID=121402 RepID=A0A8T2P0Y2_9TELE|nr:hypothetical protein JZ751_009953 [Albula glossodonta]
MLKWVRGGVGLQDFSDSLLGATSFLTQRVQKPGREESSRAPWPNYRAEKNQTGLTEVLPPQPKNLAELIRLLLLLATLSA